MLGLAFSGGKDSLACWYIYRSKDPIVIWVNTGKVYPETLALVNEIRAECSEFIEVKTNQQAQNDEFGLPADCVPINHTLYGMNFTGQQTVKVQSYLGCCAENKSLPLMKAAKERGITHLIRGQRNDEAYISTAKNGDMVEGITFVQPIEDWTTEQVKAFLLTQRPRLPEHFDIEHSSLDCYDCTAYACHSSDRVEWMKSAYPDLYAQYDVRWQALKSALLPTLKHFEVA